MNFGTDFESSDAKIAGDEVVSKKFKLLQPHRGQNLLVIDTSAYAK